MENRARNVPALLGRAGEQGVSVAVLSPVFAPDTSQVSLL